MKKLLAFLILVAVALVVAGVPAGIEAQDKAVAAKKSLAAFRLNDVDGEEVELDSESLKNHNLAICFLTTWSELSQRQAKAVAAQAKGFDGKVVFVAGGASRLVRDMRQSMAVEGAIWLKANSTVANDFRETFDPAVSLDRVPALVVVDKERKVLHASMGELTSEEIVAAMKIK